MDGGAQDPQTDAKQRFVSLDFIPPAETWSLAAQAFERADHSRFSDSGERYWHYRVRSLPRTLVCGVLGVMSILFSVFILQIEPAVRLFGDMMGFVRMGLMFLGALLIFAGWPEYRHRDDTDEDFYRRMEAKEAVARKGRR